MGRRPGVDKRKGSLPEGLERGLVRKPQGPASTPFGTGCAQWSGTVEWCASAPAVEGIQTPNPAAQRPITAPPPGPVGVSSIESVLMLARTQDWRLLERASSHGGAVRARSRFRLRQGARSPQGREPGQGAEDAGGDAISSVVNSLTPRMSPSLGPLSAWVRTLTPDSVGDTQHAIRTSLVRGVSMPPS